VYQTTRKSKVTDEGIIVGGNENITQGDVTMDNTVVMQVCNPLRNIDTKLQHP